MIRRSLVLLSLILSMSAPVFGDEPPKKEPAKAAIPAGDETLAAPTFPPFPVVAKGLEASKGFNTLYADKKREKALIEIPSSGLKRPFILATSIAGGTTRTGWQWGSRLVYWTLRDKRLMLIEKNTQYKGSIKTPVGRSVARTYTDQLILTVPIVTKSLRGGYVIDAKLLFARYARKFFGGFAGALDSSLAVLSKYKTFPQNTEIAVTMPERGGGAFVTLHYSMRKLPRSTYKPRLADDRIGYFLTVSKDYTAGKRDDGRFVRFINRWDVRKKDPKLALSPPAKPIVFYVEKTVPVEYRRYVREGILEWNRAFKKLGFDKAVVVRQQTNDEFNDLDPEDARYNFFRWITSGRAFAMGPSRVNPLTGEILDADIIFDDDYANFRLVEYHRYVTKDASEVGDLRRFLDGPKSLEKTLRASYRPTLPMAKKSPFQKALDAAITKRFSHDHHVCTYMGEHYQETALAYLTALAKDPKALALDYVGNMVRLTVTHEVGHTLGLRHNFIASTWRSLDEINSADKPAYTTGSVMDYNSINVATPGQVQGRYQSAGIGPYDMWAIEYGYHPKGDTKTLKKITDKVAKHGLAFATDGDIGGPDPYVNRWDMGRDPLNFAKSRVELAKSMIKDVEQRVLKKGDSFKKLRSGFGLILGQYSRSASWAARFIGGVRVYRDHVGDPEARDPKVPVPAAKQREALTFLLRELLSDKNFQFSPKMLRRLGGSHWSHWGTRGSSFEIPLSDRILSIQNGALGGFLNNATLGRVLDNEYQHTGADVLTVAEIMQSLQDSLFSELSNSLAKADGRKRFISLYRANLQRAYVTRLINFITKDADNTRAAVRTMAWAHVRSLKAAIEAFEKKDGYGSVDLMTRAHLAESKVRLQKALEATYRLR